MYPFWDIIYHWLTTLVRNWIYRRLEWCACCALLCFVYLSVTRVAFTGHTKWFLWIIIYDKSFKCGKNCKTFVKMCILTLVNVIYYFTESNNTVRMFCLRQFYVCTYNIRCDMKCYFTQNQSAYNITLN